MAETNDTKCKTKIQMPTKKDGGRLLVCDVDEDLSDAQCVSAEEIHQYLKTRPPCQK